MAWVKHWIVPFGDLSGATQYQVSICEWDYSGDVVTLTGAGTPFVTMEADDDHVFRAVRGQTGYLSVVADDGALLESLMPKTNTEKLVRLESGTYDGSTWAAGNVLWQGFLCAQVFTQPWEGSRHVLQFPVNSLLQSLDSVLLEDSLLTNSGRLSLLLTYGYNKLLKGETPYTRVSTYDDMVLDHSWLYTCIEWRVFFTESDVAHEGSVSVERRGWSYYEALDAACALFGLVMRERGGWLYVCRYGNDDYEIHGAEYSWSQIQTIAGGGSVELPEKVKMSHLSLLGQAEWKGADSTVTYVPGGNDARVVLNLNADSNMLFSLRESPSDTSAYVTIEVSDGVVYVQPHDGGTTPTYAFALYTLSHTYETYDRGWNLGVTYNHVGGSSPTYADCLASSVAGSASFNPLDPEETVNEIVTGAFPVRFYHRPTGEGMELFKSGVLLNMQASDHHPTVAPNTTNTFKRVDYHTAIFHQTGFGAYRFTPGYLHLQIGIELFARLFHGTPGTGWWPNPDFGSFPNQQVFKLRLRLRVGTKYWNGTSWSSTVSTFQAAVQGGTLVTNYSDDMPFSNQGGLYIPIEGGTTGDVDFVIYDDAEYEQFDDLHSYIMTDCSLEFKPTYRLTVDDRTQNVYRKSITTNGFKGDHAIELKIGTYNNNVPSAQFVVNAAGDYLEAFPYYLPTGDNSMERPERHLVNRLAEYYKEVRRVFSAIVGIGLPLCDKVYDYNGRVFVGIGSQANWRDGVETVKWIEVENPATMGGDGIDTVVPSGAAPYSKQPGGWDESGGGIQPAPEPVSPDESRMYLGTCATAAGTAAKVVTVDAFPTEEVDGVVQPVVGTTIGVLFTATNTAANATLNVNDLGGASIYYNTAVYTSGGNRAGYKNRYTFFVWNGTYWVWQSQGVDDNSTYSNVSLGNGIAVQNNSSQVTAVTATLASYALSANGRVSVVFTYDVLANSTLNVNAKGAKGIRCYDESGALVALPAGKIKAHDVATFVYNGTYYVLTSNMRPTSGGGMIGGYWNSADGLFYADSGFTTSLTGDDLTLYRDLSSKMIYVFNGETFELLNGEYYAVTGAEMQEILAGSNGS